MRICVSVAVLAICSTALAGEAKKRADFECPNELAEAIPKNLYPRPFPNESRLDVTRRDKWIAQNLTGKTLVVHGRIRDTTPATNKGEPVILLYLTPDKTWPRPPLSLFQVSSIAFPSSDEDTLQEFAKGSPISILGKIQVINTRRGNDGFWITVLLESPSVVARRPATRPAH